MKSGTPFPIKDLIFFKQGIYNLHESETHEYELLLRCEAEGLCTFPSQLFYKIMTDERIHKLYIDHIEELLNDYFEQVQNIYCVNLDYQELFYEETLVFLKKFKYKDRLKIEFTERIPVRRNNAYEELVPVNIIKAVKQMGYSIALDDFLSGVNTFETLYALDELISRVKISWVGFKRILPSKEAHKLLFSLAHIISELGKEVVIEGVEEQGLLDSFPKEWKQQSYYYELPRKIK